MSYEHTIRAKVGIPEYWEWCSNTLNIGSWKMRIGIMGASVTYCFSNQEDLTAFKLRFGI
jgi:hypothetical protein